MISSYYGHLRKMNTYIKQSGVSLILGILFIISGYKVDLSFSYKKLFLIEKQIATIKNQLQTKKMLMQQNRSRFETQFIPLVPDRGIADILDPLEKALATAQVDLNSIEPQEAKENQWVKIYPIKVEIKGEYKNLLQLINQLLHLPVLTTIEDLNLQKKQEEKNNENLCLQILLMVYKNKYRTVQNPTNLSIPLSRRDIFKPEISAKNLNLWSTKELCFLGLIKLGKMVLGIISDPLGEIYHVKVGDKIGLNQSEIMAIDAAGIRTTEQSDYILRERKC